MTVIATKERARGREIEHCKDHLHREFRTTDKQILRSVPANPGGALGGEKSQATPKALPPALSQWKGWNQPLSLGIPSKGVSVPHRGSGERQTSPTPGPSPPMPLTLIDRHELVICLDRVLAHEKIEEEDKSHL